MDRQTAQEVLRLSDSPSRKEVVTAYSRLARRYPMQQFPERHARLLEAKDALLNPQMAFKAILTEQTVDLTWLNRHERQKTNQASSNVNDVQVDPRQYLEAWCRPHFKKGIELFPDESGCESMLEEMIKVLGPKGLFDLMN